MMKKGVVKNNHAMDKSNSSYYPGGTNPPSSSEEAGSQSDSGGSHPLQPSEGVLSRTGSLSNTLRQGTAETASSLSDIDERMESELLSDKEEADALVIDPVSPRAEAQLEEATKHLHRLKVKPKMTQGERKLAVKAKLEAQGVAWDPKKFGKSKRENKLKRTRKGEDAQTSPKTLSEPTLGQKRTREEAATPPSAETVRKKQRIVQPVATVTSGEGALSYKDTLTDIKMAVAISDYPTSRLTSEQGVAIESALMEKLDCLPDGSFPIFSGTYIERGALIISCSNVATANWLKQIVSEVKPLGENVELVVGERKDVLRATKVLLKAPAKLVGLSPDKICDLLNKQNPTLKVKEWTRLSANEDPKGKVMVFLIDDESLEALKAANFKAHVGLWTSTVLVLAGRERGSAKGRADQSASQ